MTTRERDLQTKSLDEGDHRMTPRKNSTDDPQNAALEHTRGGQTTRDTIDAGVDMLPGDASEPVGPEDAFGPGRKRGDYSNRIDSGPHLVAERIPEEERERDAHGNIVGPHTRLVDVSARVAHRATGEAA